ncbi:MAG: hypothetical protein Fur005_00750 [Roseiflexaceae bacterium]
MLSAIQPQLLPGHSSRPTLTRLVLLVAANPAVADSLLRDPIDRLASSHPHYMLNFDAHDRATLADIRQHAQTVPEFLNALADVVDGRA